MKGELNVRSAGLYPDLADDVDRSIPHDLIFFVRQGLRRGNRDAVAGVDPHGVQVLDRADDDHVVLEVPHHLQLELLPPDHRLFEQDRVDPARVEPPLDDSVEALRVVGGPPPGPPKGEARPYDHRIADLLGDRPGLFQGTGVPASRNLQADLLHGGLEQLPVLGLLDRIRVGPDHLHPVGREHPLLGQLGSGVQRGLASHGRQQGVRPLLLDDLCHVLGENRFDVGPVRNERIGHDGGRIAVDQDDLVPFLLERLARLRAGIIEFACLADHDRPGSDNQDLLDVIPARHG